MASKDGFVEKKGYGKSLAQCWKYFLWKPRTDEVKCKECDKVLKCKNSTSGMITHLKTVHKISYESKSDPGRKPNPKISDHFKAKSQKESPDEIVGKLCADSIFD